MIRHISVGLLITAFVFKLLADDDGAAKISMPFPTNNHFAEVPGIATNGLQPSFLFEMEYGKRSLAIDYSAQTNFARYTWLQLNNFVGSKLQLFLTNGLEVKATNADALSAMDLPRQTTVSNVMRGFKGPSSQRGMQWLETELGVKFPTKRCGLEDLFDVSLTNEVVLHITPELYKVESNGITASLVEFPTVKIKLTSDGTVQEIK